MMHDAARDGQRIGVVLGQMVGHAARAAVHQCAPQCLRVDYLACGGIHQLRAAQEHRTLVAHDHQFVAKRRDVGAAGRRRAEDEGDLRDPLGRHLDLVVHHRSALAIVGEDVGQVGQEGSARLDHRDARQPVLPGEHLRPHMPLGGHAEHRAALHRGVVDDQHAGTAFDVADTGDQGRARRHAVVHVGRGELADLEEWCTRVKQRRDAFARQHLAAALVELAGPFVATCRGLVPAYLERRGHSIEGGASSVEGGACGGSCGLKR
jgi:hypothetical protein